MKHKPACPCDLQWALWGGGGGCTKDCPQPLTLSWIDNNLFMCKIHINFIDYHYFSGKDIQILFVNKYFI